MNIEALRKLVMEACGEEATGDYQGKEKPSGGKMARTDLVAISKDAQELVNMFGDDAELPDWVEAKLTKAADYLTSVKKYIGGEIVRQQGGMMENLKPGEKLKELPSFEDLSRLVQEVAVMFVNNKILEAIFKHKNEFGDDYVKIYQFANQVFSDIVALREKLDEAKRERARRLGSRIYEYHEPETGEKTSDKETQYIIKRFTDKMSHNEFDAQLEKYEVNFKTEYPQSIRKIEHVLYVNGYRGWANAIRKLYSHDF